MVAIYVDDLLIVGPYITTINHFKSMLKKTFEMSDLGIAKTLLGIDIHREKDGSVFISQERYIDQVLKRYGITADKACFTPMSSNDIEAGEPFDIHSYLQLGGSISWPALGTRPDIAYAVGYLGRFNANPGIGHHMAQKRVLRYLKTTKSWGLYYPANGDVSGLICHTDADYGGCKIDRKSTTGNQAELYGTSVDWQTVKQQLTADSTLVAEYIALATMIKQALWLKMWMKEVGIDISTILVKIDNKSAIDYAQNAKFSQRTKHIDIRHHFIRDHIENESIKLEYVPTEANTADALTKPLDRVKFERFRGQLGMRARPDST